MHRFIRSFLSLSILLGISFLDRWSAVMAKDHALFAKQKASLMQLLQKKQYGKAQLLIEQLLPAACDQQERIALYYHQAYCSFYEKDYTASAAQFQFFLKQYPHASQVEEALFMQGYSLACKKVDLYLDQATTYEALDSLQSYLATYPEGAYQEQAVKNIEKLEHHLMEKDFAAITLYMQLKHWDAAIVCLQNFEQHYPFSSYSKRVLASLIQCCEKRLDQATDQEMKDVYHDLMEQCIAQRDAIMISPSS